MWSEYLEDMAKQISGIVVPAILPKSRISGISKMCIYYAGLKWPISTHWSNPSRTRTSLTAWPSVSLPAKPKQQEITTAVVRSQKPESLNYMYDYALSEKWCKAIGNLDFSHIEKFIDSRETRFSKTLVKWILHHMRPLKCLPTCVLMGQEPNDAALIEIFNIYSVDFVARSAKRWFRLMQLTSIISHSSLHF